MDVAEQNSVLRKKVLDVTHEREMLRKQLTDDCDAKLGTMLTSLKQLRKQLKARWTPGGVILVILVLTAIGAVAFMALVKKLKTA